MTDIRAPWSDAENDATVADYFAMLDKELSGKAVNKADHNRHLASVIARSRGAIEFKHQNISAILLGLGQPWIDGYKPAANFQNSLVEAVLRWLDVRPQWLRPSEGAMTASGFADRSPLWIGPPPTLSNQPPVVDPGIYEAHAMKFDAAGRDARNRELGQAGEARIVGHERDTLAMAGRGDLAARVEWVSLTNDSAGFDIRSFESDGSDRLIEVKTTNGWERTPFYISRNECAVAARLTDSWSLVRLYDFARDAKAFAIRPPLERHVELMPTSFLASLR